MATLSGKKRLRFDLSLYQDQLENSARRRNKQKETDSINKTFTSLIFPQECFELFINMVTSQGWGDGGLKQNNIYIFLSLLWKVAFEVRRGKLLLFNLSNLHQQFSQRRRSYLYLLYILLLLCLQNADIVLVADT